MSVCLVHTREEDEFPFISSIEAIFIGGVDNYKLMNNKTMFHVHSRTNYGANQSVE